MKNAWKVIAGSIALLFSLSLLPIDALAKGGGGFSSGSGRSFSSPSRSSSTPSRSFSPSPSRSYSTPSPSPSKTYQSPSPSTSPGRTYTTPPAPSRTPSRQYDAPSATQSPKSTYDSGASRALKQQESRKTFERSNPPSTTATSAAPKSDYERQRTRDLKRELNHEKIQNRRLRQEQRYSSYYGRPTPCCYNDGFNVFFWLWLLDRPNHQAEWAYHHRDQIDPNRLEELRRKDADLDRRMAELETRGVKRDSSWTPSEFQGDKDLMYSDEKVQKLYEEKQTSGFPWFWVLVGLATLGLLYLVIFKIRWMRRSET